MKLLNSMGREYSLIALNDNETRIETGEKSIIVNHNAGKIVASWLNWKNTLIQYAFPYLTDDEREFLITGLTTYEWNTIFSDN